MQLFYEQHLLHQMYNLTLFKGIVQLQYNYWGLTDTVPFGGHLFFFSQMNIFCTIKSIMFILMEKKTTTKNAGQIQLLFGPVDNIADLMME